VADDLLEPDSAPAGLEDSRSVAVVPQAAAVVLQQLSAERELVGSKKAAAGPADIRVSAVPAAELTASAVSAGAIVDATKAAGGATPPAAHDAVNELLGADLSQGDAGPTSDSKLTAALDTLGYEAAIGAAGGSSK
jgi:hypothetical protein